MSIAKPFVKWVGGKRAILNIIQPLIPANINNYYEPFVGGGALFFSIYERVNFSFILDLNADLMVAYIVIKNTPLKLISLLKEHAKNHCKDYYYRIRSLQKLINPIEKAARFIYLMKTCFNGLYRVNKNDEFNASLGSYLHPNICDEENIIAVSEALRRADIKHSDFTDILPQKGDFVYFDPPYYPIAKGYFTKYTSSNFLEKDQIRLRDFALELSKNGVNVMISNSYSEFIIHLYEKYFNLRTISAPRYINCKSERRQPINELLITNY